MMNNGYGEDKSCCYFHPKQLVIGVCPLCLNERLLILASKQGQRSNLSSSSSTTGSHRFLQGFPLKKPQINLPKIFALGSFLNRRELKHLKSQDFDDHDASTSQEDSFISIKFEENGIGLWEKGKVSKVSLEHCSMAWKATLSKDQKVGNTSVIEHPKAGGSLRWRKRMGHLFQLVRWKRSNKAEGVKVARKSWITRTLTKRN